MGDKTKTGSFNGGIQMKIGLAIVILTTCILTAYGFWDYTSMKRRMTDELDTFSKNTVNRLGRSLVSSVYNLDEEGMRDIVNSEMADERILAVIIREKYAKSICVVRGKKNIIREEEKKRFESAVSQVSEPDMISKTGKLKSDEMGLGTVEIRISGKQLHNELRKQVWKIALTIVIMDLILLAALAISLHFLLIRPISHILDIANAVSAGDFGKKIDIRQNDEIGKLAAAFREMESTISLVAKELDGMIEAVAKGNLDARGNSDLFSGGWKKLVVGLNSLIDAFVSPFHTASEYVDRIARGDIPDMIDENLEGDFNKMAQNLNHLIKAMNETIFLAKRIAEGDLSADVTVRSETDGLMIALSTMTKRLKAMIEELNGLTDSARKGILDMRGDPSAFKGGWRDLVLEINSLIDTFTVPFSTAAGAVDRIATGDIPGEITEAYEGDFNEIRDSINRLISNLRGTVRIAEKIAGGDLTVDVAILSERDILGKSLEAMVKQLKNIIGEITEKSDTLTIYSGDSSDLSGVMSESAGKLRMQSEKIKSSSGEMSRNMASVTESMNQLAANTDTVASSTEEMSASIGEVAGNSENARAITNEAVSQARLASGRLEELSTAASEIGKVTETIIDISEQTKLLALNATIEAARAGEVGKGFAVVATEIKELARNAAFATQEIRERIESIQDSAKATVSEIGKILNIIGEVNDIVSAIATAMEEQSGATNEIANSLAMISGMISDVNLKVEDGSRISGNIALEMADTLKKSNDMTDNSLKVKNSAETLFDLAVDLKKMVNMFKI